MPSNLRLFVAARREFGAAPDAAIPAASHVRHESGKSIRPESPNSTPGDVGALGRFAKFGHAPGTVMATVPPAHSWGSIAQVVYVSPAPATKNRRFPLSVKVRPAKSGYRKVVAICRAAARREVTSIEKRGLRTNARPNPNLARIAENGDLVLRWRSRLQCPVATCSCSE